MKKILLSLLALVAMVVPSQAQTELLTDGVITGIESWFGDGSWQTETDSYATWENGVAKVYVNQNKDAQWKAQFKVLTTLTTLNPEKQYVFKCNVNANKDVNNVTLKIMDNVEMSMNSQVSLVAGDNTVTAKFMGQSQESNGVIVYDFGYASAGTELTITDFSLVEQDPVVEEGPEKWDAKTEGNLWTAMAPNHFWYAPGWAQIADPEVTENNGAYTFTLSQATELQWQAQVAFKSELSTSADKKYDFQVVLKSTQTIPGATIKFVQNGDDNNYYTADRHYLNADKEYVFQMPDVQGKDIEKLNLFLDFGGNPANSTITISDIIVREHVVEPTAWHVCGSFNGWAPEDTSISFYPTDDANVLVAKAASFQTGEWGFKVIDGTAWGCQEIGADGDALVIANGEAGAVKLGGGNIYINEKNAQLTLTNVVFTLTFVDGAPATLAVTCDPIQETAPDYYLPGTCKGWNFNDATKFTYQGNGVYTVEYDEFYADFKVAKGSNWNNLYGGLGRDMEVGKDYTLVAGGDNSGFANGLVVKNAVITLTVAADGTHTLRVDGTAKEEHSYGLVGNFQGWSCTSAPLFEEQADGSWTIDVNEFPGGEGFKVSIDKSWTCFCPQGDANETIQFNTPVTCARKDGKDFNIGESGKKYDVHVVLVVADDAQSATLTVTDIATGIEMLNTTVDATVVYNLAGQRLAQPQKGINIINGKKVMIK